VKQPCLIIFAFFSLLFVTLPVKGTSFGNNKLLVCSTQLGNSFSSCPNNKKNAALAAIPIHTGFSSCDGGSQTCRGDDIVRESITSFFTVFDIDNQRTVKYEVVVVPNVYDPQGRLIVEGSKSAKLTQASHVERQLTDALHTAATNRNAFVRTWQLTGSGSDNWSDGNGNASSVNSFSRLTCTTAMDYLTMNSTCADDLTRDIDLGVQDDATFHAMISAISQAETIINILLPDGADLSGLTKLSEFKIVLNMSDGSRLVIDVKVTQGAVEVVLNENASRTSSGRSLAHARVVGVPFYRSLDEVNSAAGAGIPFGCRPAEIRVSELTKIRTETRRNSQGETVVVVVYAFRDKFYTFQECN